MFGEQEQLYCFAYEAGVSAWISKEMREGLGLASLLVSKINGRFDREFGLVV